MIGTRGVLAVCAALALAGCAGNMATTPVGPVSTTGSVNPASAAYFQQSVGDRVLFMVDEATLNAAARATLDQQARWLTQNSGFTAVIEGHADEQGTREYNLALGARRASAVQEYLVNAGVAPSRLRTVTFGKERPIEICSDEACYAKNRRAVTVVASGAGV
jgi:peptidoglycan-associated lipoprotein